jgi:hypothetical protein
LPAAYRRKVNDVRRAPKSTRLELTRQLRDHVPSPRGGRPFDRLREGNLYKIGFWAKRWSKRFRICGVIDLI